MSELLPIASLRRDGGTQPRAGLDPVTVEAYADSARDGARFPDIGVVYDGTDHWVWDGFHRIAGFEAAGLCEINADVIPGTRRDAVLLAAGANATHGLRRTNDDKRRAVLILLGDPEWSAWSDREIARRAHVGHPLVAELRRVTGSSSSERTYQTRHGGVASMDVAAIGRRAADVATIRAADPLALYRVIREERDRKQAAKKVRRGEREAELADKINAANAALPAMIASGKRYGLILEDPEWPWEAYSDDTGMDRAEENHYPTSSLADICARPIGELAARDCVYLLWAPPPRLEMALQVMKARGFTYKTNREWRKILPGKARGRGYWFHFTHEHVLLGTRGSPPCPAMGEQWDSVFDAPRGANSAKPDEMHRWADRFFPNVPKLECNARTAWPGWDVWGAEAPEPVPAALFEPYRDLKPTELDAWAALAAIDLPALPILRNRNHELR